MAPEHTTAQMAALADVLGVGLRPFSAGGESRTFAVEGTDQLVSVSHDWPSAADRTRVVVEAEVLRRLAPLSPVAVPEVVRVSAEHGYLVVRRLPGAPLITVPAERRSSCATPVAEAVGTLLATLHRLPRQDLEGVVPVDDDAPADWRAETRELAEAVDGVLTPAQRDDLRRFLARPAPAPPSALVLTHNDLGIEHVLVEPVTGRVTGVVDWGDTAFADPAYDFGLLARDLGPDALAVGLATYRRAGAAVPDGLVERARYYAACTLVEDLAHGIAHDRPAYTAKSLAGWQRTLAAATG